MFAVSILVFRFKEEISICWPAECSVHKSMLLLETNTVPIWLYFLAYCAAPGVCDSFDPITMNKAVLKLSAETLHVLMFTAFKRTDASFTII